MLRIGGALLSAVKRRKAMHGKAKRSQGCGGVLQSIVQQSIGIAGQGEVAAMHR